MDPYLGEIIYVAFNYAPRGWAICAGQLLPINQNQALFSLLGTTYGGNGQTTFALPDLRGRVVIGQGQGPGLLPYPVGTVGGYESADLLQAHLPSHSHAVAASAATATTNSPTAGVFAKPKVVRGGNLYAPAGGGLAASDVLQPTGGASPHENRAPGMALVAIIALQGIFPSRN